ncbi:Dam family site-specific DNA-(adenine-N6)-methyltransferase [Agrococcus sp. ARC_14]|uniref:DNA adenine methylase n=1 Tax=Agrococcus sp. ARC_14 TaxID=2919927 RepID=UPI001F0695F2|nr:Dam family site-specific DNA-(adenine-N6)-methyltransferase [Agrococcus sp. ARC_14]MCH1881897.1 Dam family site-specific DNA-(adenine-N6)-methyltransferase [Agrococcus sp. ARC_14]
MRTIDHLSTDEVEAEPEATPWTRLDRNRLEERAAATLSTNPRPFIRWAGSKQRLLSQIVEHLPAKFRTYHEPFFGAGSMYFLLEPERAVINDSCEPLIDMYRTIAAHPQAVFAQFEDMDLLDREYYYMIRSSTKTDPIEAAARFIYLNRGSWNGLYRVNSSGAFNVPYGSPRSRTIIDWSHLAGASKQLRRAGTLIQSGDFEQSLATVAEGDLVFLDPPYASSKKREGFVDYNEKLFTWEDQVRLAKCADRLRSRGAHVIVTNAYNSAIKELYPKFREFALVRRSSLAANVKLRRPVAESLLVS